MKCRTDCGDYVGENKTENIADDKSAENVREEVNPTQQTLAFYLAVKTESKKQTQQIYEDSSRESIFEGEQIGIPNS